MANFPLANAALANFVANFSANFPVEEAATVLVVDGYNMIGAWPKLKPLFRQSTLAIARHQLLEDLAGFVSFRGYHSVVVFDAHAQTDPPPPEVTPPAVDVLFTTQGETADTCIERLCACWQWEPWRVRVATSDRLIQLVAAGFDAEWLTALSLAEEIQRAKQQVRQTLRDRGRQANGRPRQGLDRYLDHQTRQKLEQWRRG